jgi:hypothetical protein
MKRLAVFAWIFASTAWAGPRWLDRSHEVFLTPQMRGMAEGLRDFPVFWWNFIFVEAPDPAVSTLCDRIALMDGVRRLPCRHSADEIKSLTADWARDLPRRRNFPGWTEIRRGMRETLAKAALPMERSWIELLRLDPMGTLAELKAQLEHKADLNSSFKGGLMRDPDSGRVVLPVQFSFPPTEAARTQALLTSIGGLCSQTEGCASVHVFGAHAATLENESRVRQDVDLVSKLGTLALGLLCAFLLMTRRHRVLALVPWLVMAIAGAAAATVLVFGKIHGLTLAFGPGLIGLAMDYGIHSCFLDPRSRKTWRANWIGIWTTNVILILLAFSSIPLLRQMMFFAVFGLCLSYGLFYFLMRRRPKWFETEHYPVTAKRLRFMNVFAWLFLIAAPLIFFRTMEFDLQHFNFESAKTRELREWFFAKANAPSPYVFVHAQMVRLTSDIAHDGPGEYLPGFDEQQSHLATWRAALCGDGHHPLTPVESRFYAPFLDTIRCDHLQPADPGAAPPEYVKDFMGGGRFVTLFFPKDDGEIARLKSQYPAISSPREIFSSFPAVLFRELSWMLPLGFAGAFFLLWLHYRHIGWSALAVVPFFTGLGCYAVASWALSLPVSFISLVGLLMVFGCSLDYGVFVMDFLLFRKDEKPGVWSALSLCAAATMAGFAPMVFARHPVLHDLGHALLWGTLGTYVGSLWGTPSVYSMWSRLRAGWKA